MKDLILALDIGNTSIHLGVFTRPARRRQRRASPRRAGRNPKLIARENILTEKALKFFKQWRGHKDSLPFTSSRIISAVGLALMCSTQPSIDEIVEHWVKEVFGIKLLKAREDFKIPMPILVDEPSKVGVDRLLNAFAAYHLTGKVTLVIDFGTAITLDIVSAQGEFLGGIIAPGVTSMAKALHQDCTLLPLIQPRPTEQVIGKNTQQAMQAGLYLGTIGLIQYLVERINKELKKRPSSSEGAEEAPYIMATGNDAELIKPGLPFIRKVIPDLTLTGLVLAYICLPDLPEWGQAGGQAGL